MFEPVDYDIGGIGRTLIKSLSVFGGGGGNAVNHMVSSMVKKRRRTAR